MSAKLRVSPSSEGLPIRPGTRARATAARSRPTWTPIRRAKGHRRPIEPVVDERRWPVLLDIMEGEGEKLYLSVAESGRCSSIGGCRPHQRTPASQSQQRQALRKMLKSRFG